MIDADKIVADLYFDKHFIEKMKNKFQEYNFIENDEISREKLAKLVFKKDDFKKELENFVHPFVMDKIEDFFRVNSSKKLAVASIPLLFECGWQKYFDKTILVISDLRFRKKRLMKRNNLTKEQADLRISAQMPQEQKIAQADFIIENNFDIKSLNDTVKDLVESLNAG